MAATDRSDPVLGELDGILADLEALYKDLHANPELSMQEERTSGKAAEWLEAAGFEVARGVGKTGVVGLLENGEGPTVMLRADMDALPVKEDTGLPYASDKTSTDGEGTRCRLPTPAATTCMPRAWRGRRRSWRGLPMHGAARSWPSSSRPRRPRRGRGP